MQVTSVAAARHARLRHFVRRRRRQQRTFLLRVLALTAAPFVLAGTCLEVASLSVCTYSRTEVACMQAYEIAKSCDLFELMAHRLPKSLHELEDPPPPMTAVLSDMPLDPWGHAYAFVNPALRSDQRFDVVSAGPDGVFYTDDDCGNWQRPR